jgi:hypothetical protein
MPRNACPEPARNPRTVGMSPDHVGRRFDPAYTEVTAFGGRDWNLLSLAREMDLAVALFEHFLINRMTAILNSGYRPQKCYWKALMWHFLP